MACSEVNAVTLLCEDHREIEAQFLRLEGCKDSALKNRLKLRLCYEIEVHFALEEQFLFPALLQSTFGAAGLCDATAEHDGLEQLIADFARMMPDERFFSARLAMLKDHVIHHFRTEEWAGSGLFAQARASGADLCAIGRTMASQRQLMLERVDKVVAVPASVCPAE